jgi:hypothetical protein
MLELPPVVVAAAASSAKQSGANKQINASERSITLKTFLILFFLLSRKL